MAELEVHHEVEHSDPFGQRVGLLASALAVLLAVVTIASHRAHTEAVVQKAEANDQWSFYQAKRMKLHNLELGRDLLTVLPSTRTPEVGKLLERYESEAKRYQKEGDDTQAEARSRDREVKSVEARALRFDLGEGMLEIGLVLSSLYFIARKKLFPAIGVAAGVGGVLVALAGYLM